MGKGRRRIKGGGGKGFPISGGKGAPKGAPKGAAKGKKDGPATGKSPDAKQSAPPGPDGAATPPAGDSQVNVAGLASSSNSDAERRAVETAANSAEANYHLTLYQLFKESLFIKFLLWVGQMINRIFAFFTKRDFPASHYATMALVIFLLIYGFSWAVNKTTSKPKDKNKKGFFGYRFSNAFQRFTGVKPVTDPRPTISGRCDNIDFIEKRVGNGGVCVTDKLPKPLEWIISSEKIPELNDLPPSIIRKITNNSAKSTVSIPWIPMGMVYVPYCDGATFSDGSNAYLLTDTADNVSCKKNVVDKLTYKEKKRYIKDYKVVDLNTYIKPSEEGNAPPDMIGKVSPGEVCSIQEANKLGIFNKTRFYKVGYENLRTYNKELDRGSSFAYKLCTENTAADTASVLCPLHENAGIGFTAMPGNKCVTAECPPGFTEDKKDPMLCKKPIREKVVPLSSRNDEQYDDWYTIPNYHLGNKYSSSNTVHYGPCPTGSIPYYSTDPVDDKDAEKNSIDNIGTCIDKSLFIGGKYAGTADFCPISLIKRTGSNKKDLMEYYTTVSGNSTIPDSEVQKINTLVEGLTSSDFMNLTLLSKEMETACGKLNQDTDKLRTSYNICQQLAKNEDGFVAKFAGEPPSLIKLRRDATKYSCQQLFGVPPQDRNKRNAKNQNASRLEEETLNFPGVEEIQFDQYIQEYDDEIRERDAVLPPITTNEEKSLFLTVLNTSYIVWIFIIIVIVLTIYLIYYNRKRIGNFYNCNLANPIISILNAIRVIPIDKRKCLNKMEMDAELLREKQQEVELARAKKEEQKRKKKEQEEAAAEKAEAEEAAEAERRIQAEADKEKKGQEKAEPAK